MTNTIKALNRQSLLDIALQTAGSMEAAIDLAQANGLELSDDLIDGQCLQTIPERNSDIVARYDAEHIRPATALDDNDTQWLRIGIGYWRINIDFIVS